MSEQQTAGAHARRKPLVACQCARLIGMPCNETATAEDFLCDTCREGCNAAFGAEGRFTHFATGPISPWPSSFQFGPA